MLSPLPMQGFAISHSNYERSLTQQSHLKTPWCHAQGFQRGSAVMRPGHPLAPALSQAGRWQPQAAKVNRLI